MAHSHIHTLHTHTLTLEGGDGGRRSLFGGALVGVRARWPASLALPLAAVTSASTASTLPPFTSTLPRFHDPSQRSAQGCRRRPVPKSAPPEIYGWRLTLLRLTLSLRNPRIPDAAVGWANGSVRGRFVFSRTQIAWSRRHWLCAHCVTNSKSPTLA